MFPAVLLHDVVELLGAVAGVLPHAQIDSVRALLAPDVSTTRQGTMYDVRGLILLLVNEDRLGAPSANRVSMFHDTNRNDSLAAVHEDGVSQHLHLHEYHVLMLREAELPDRLVVNFWINMRSAPSLCALPDVQRTSWGVTLRIRGAHGTKDRVTMLLDLRRRIAQQARTAVGVLAWVHDRDVVLLVLLEADLAVEELGLDALELPHLRLELLILLIERELELKGD